jgi:hypothetical protein
MNDGAAIFWPQSSRNILKVRSHSKPRILFSYGENGRDDIKLIKNCGIERRKV